MAATSNTVKKPIKISENAKAKVQKILENSNVNTVVITDGNNPVLDNDIFIRT